MTDLTRLAAFLGSKSRRASIEAVDQIWQGIESLHQFPLRTPIVLQPDIHQLVVRFGRDGYVVRYRVRQAEVVIMRIYHGKEQRRRSAT